MILLLHVREVWDKYIHGEIPKNKQKTALAGFTGLVHMLNLKYVTF